MDCRSLFLYVSLSLTYTHAYIEQQFIFMVESRKWNIRWVVWLRGLFWLKLCSVSSSTVRPLSTSCWKMMTMSISSIKCHRGVFVCALACIYTHICPFLHCIVQAPLPHVLPFIFDHLSKHVHRSMPLLAGPCPFCPVMWPVLRRRAGVVSVPEPRPVVPVGWPGGEGRGGPGIRVRAQWLGAVVSTLLARAQCCGDAGV